MEQTSYKENHHYDWKIFLEGEKEGKSLTKPWRVLQCPPLPKCTLCTQVGKGHPLLLASVSSSIKSGA